MTAVDDLFRQIWASALGQSTLAGGSDDFFAAGGDSLAAIAFVTGLEERLGVVVDSGWLYEHPCLPEALEAMRSLVAHTEAHGGCPSGAPTRWGTHADGSVHPLSFQQQGLLAVLDRVGQAHSYQVAYAVALPSAADVSRLRGALAVIGLRHGALRTSVRDGAQYVDERPPELQRFRPGFGQQVQEAQTWAGLHDPGDGLGRARFALVEGDSEHLLVLAASQMVMDPWSWGVLLRDLCQVYAGGELEVGDRLDYSDYARWQRAYLSGAEYERHLAFWRERCTGYPPTGMILPGAPPDAPSAGPAATLPVTVPAAILQGLRPLARSLRVSLFHLMLGLFSGAVSQWSDRNDVLVGSATANRTLAGTEDMVGYFVNGRFTRTCVPAQASVADIVTQVRAGWLQADVHQELHLEPTLFDLGVPDLVNVKFSINDIPLSRTMPVLAGRRVKPVPIGAGGSSTARRHISLRLAPGRGGLHGAMTYRTDLVSEGTVTALLRSFNDLLLRAMAGPHTRLDA
jgi:hypothetical protein